MKDGSHLISERRINDNEVRTITIKHKQKHQQWIAISTTLKRETKKRKKRKKTVSSKDLPIRKNIQKALQYGFFVRQ